MLEFLGTIAGNILSLPGVLGLALGLTSRNYLLAASLGGLIGVFETLIFAGWSFGSVEPVELGVAVVVGVIAASLGCAIRRKGATV